MAITKTIFDKSNLVLNAIDLQTWLQANAGEYFGSISAKIESYNQQGVILKNKSDREVVWLVTRGNMLEIRDCNSQSTFLKTYINNYDAETTAFKAGYATSKGVMFTRADPRMGSYYIAQDSSGDTIVCGCTPNGDWQDPIPNWQYFVVNISTGTAYLHGAINSPSSSATYAQCVSYNVSEAAATSLAPVVQAQSDALVDGLYFVPFTENLGSVGIIELGGKKYVYNGVFALEE